MAIPERSSTGVPPVIHASRAGRPCCCFGYANAGLGAALAISSIFSASLLLFHLLINRQYGFHGDELYFLVCGSRPAWGYVDHPPLVPMIARLATSCFGVTLFAFRIFPALSLALSCLLTGLLAWRLGAKRYGQVLALTAFVCAPVFLRLGAFLNIPSFELLFWLLLAHTLVTIIKTDRPEWWLLVGVLSGLSLLNKHTTLFFGTGMAVGMLLCPQRKHLATPWPWLGGMLAFLIFLPNLIWQYRHDWATLQFLEAIHAGIMQESSVPLFLVAQLIFLNVAGAAVWLAGLWFLLRSGEGRRFAQLGWIYLTLLILMLALKGKEYYLAPAYPMLFAAGGVAIERWTASRRGYAVRGLLIAGIAAVGLLLLPIFTPIGPFDAKSRYMERLTGSPDAADIFTFDFRYEMGREQEMEALASAYSSLDPALRSDCVILANEYDMASAINVFGKRYGLPAAISGNNSYYIWGPGSASGECVIALRYKKELLDAAYARVEVCGHVPPRFLKDPAEGVPLYLCREPKVPLREQWVRFKAYF